MRQAAGDKDLARCGNRGRQRERGFHRAILQREPSVAASGIAAQCLERPRRREVQLPPRVERPAAEDRFLGERRA